MLVVSYKASSYSKHSGGSSAIDFSSWITSRAAYAGPPYGNIWAGIESFAV